MPVTSFPTSLNNLTSDPSKSDSLISSVINALEKKVGADSSLDTNSIDFKVSSAISAQAAPATTGTMTVKMNKSMVTITPSGSCTFNASGGVAGQFCAFVVTTSGVSSFNLTFNTGFKTTGVLATGTSSGKVFIVELCCDGSTWYEVSRTAAM